MEIRFQRIFLAVLMGVVVSASFVSQLQAAQPISIMTFNASSLQEGHGDVDIERRSVLEDMLDNENFELGVQFGIISIEDFESNPWVSAHFAYHITEFFYVKARYGQSEAGQSSFEKLVHVAPLLTDEQRKLSYAGLNLGYNLMPGEVFLGRDLAFNSIFSFELGAGTTEFSGEDKFTVNFTANYRVFLTDWLAWDIAMSDYIFDSSITSISGEIKTNHNLNFTTGFAYYF